LSSRSSSFHTAREVPNERPLARLEPDPAKVFPRISFVRPLALVVVLLALFAAGAYDHDLPGSLSRCAQEGEDCVDAAVFGRVGRQVEFAEDRTDMCFDSLRCDIELLGNAAVGAALCDQGEHLEFARGQISEVAC